MRGSKKDLNRILAIVMAFAMVVAMLPTQIAATDSNTDTEAYINSESESDSQEETGGLEGTGSLGGGSGSLDDTEVVVTGDYTLIVKSGTDTVEGAKVNYAVSGKLQSDAEEETIVLEGESVTDENGEIILDLTDYWSAISNENPFTLTYSVSCEGYADVTEAAVDITSYTGICILEIAKTYTVTVTYDGNGSVSTEPAMTDSEESVAGVVTVTEGTDVSVTATPENGYHVSSVTICEGDGEGVEQTTTLDDDGNEVVFVSENDCGWKGILENVNNTYEVTVIFVANVYEITVETEGGSEDCTATSSAQRVNYEDGVDVTLTWGEGYYISDVEVSLSDSVSDNSDETDAWSYDSTDYEYTEGENTLTIHVTDIKANVDVQVTYAQSADVSSIYNIASPLRKYSKTDDTSGEAVDVYVYGKEDTATVSLVEGTDYSWISETGKKIGEDKTSGLSYTSNKQIDTLYFGMSGKGAFASVVYWTSLSLSVELAFDTDAPNAAEITLNGANSTVEGGTVYYSGDVEVTVNAAESESSYSGISSIVYWLDSDEEPDSSVTLYAYQAGAEEILSSKELSFTLENDNKDHILYVKVTDRAGNSSTSSALVNFSATGIVVSMSGDKSQEAADGAYYNSLRTAEICITERSDIFNQDGLVVVNNEENGPGITVTWEEDTSSNTEDESVVSDSDVVTYVAKLTFSEEGIYDWSFTYTNLAGFVYSSVEDDEESGTSAGTGTVTATGENVYWFVYDASNPVGYVTIDEKVFQNPDNESGYYNSQLSTLSFLYFAQVIRTAEATAADDVSGVKEITYYKSNSTTALTVEELDHAAFSSNVYWSEVENESIVVYARIVDNAGNITYVSSNGAIIDNTKPEIALAPEEANENGWYDGDVSVTFTMSDTDSLQSTDTDGNEITVSNTSSGFERVEYAVYKAYYTDSSKRNSTDPVDLTADVQLEQVESLSGTWYASDITSDDTDSCQYNTETGALIDWTTGLIITADSVNNADYVVVEATLYDNAGNVSDTVTQILSVDITDPEISISYDNNDAENSMYFDAARKAAIEVKERADGFAAENTVITITAVDANDNAVSGTDGSTAGIANLISILDADGNELSTDSYSVTMDSTGKTGTIIVKNWSVAHGNSPDQDTQTIQIVYEGDANYTFAIETVDKAENDCTSEEVTYGDGTVASEIFTVDQTTPTGYVTINERVFYQDEEEETDWEEPYSPLSFGYWTQKVYLAYVTICDVTSPVNHTLTAYYKSNDTESLTVEELDDIYDAGEFSDQVFVSDITNQSFVIYARITDYAGNYTYVSSNGAIEDEIQPTITLTPEEANENGWYDKDVFVTFTMEDEDNTNTEDTDGNVTVGTLNMSSGIERVEYTVYQVYYTDNSKRNSTDAIDRTADVKMEKVDSLSGIYYASDIDTDPEVNSDAVLACSYNENTGMLTSWTAGITVSADVVNNADYVLVEAVVYDNAGNVSDTAEQVLSVDITNPTISVSYDNNDVLNSKYFDAARTATIVVTERADGFVAENTVVTISAVDAYGNAITDSNGKTLDMKDWIAILDANGKTLSASDYTITMNKAGTSGTLVVHNWSVDRGSTPDQDTQTIQIVYQADANYTFAIETEDQAENSCSSKEVSFAKGTKAESEFTIDTVDSLGTIIIGTSVWSTFRNTIQWVLFSKKTVNISVYAEDQTSPVKVEYYVTTKSGKTLSKSQLGKVSDTEWTLVGNPYELKKTTKLYAQSKDEQFEVYLRITDYAGHVVYINSDGYIVDKTAPVITMTPETPDVDNSDSSIYGYYNRNNGDTVSVKVAVTDEDSYNSYSGLSSVTWWVECNGTKTQSGTWVDYSDDDAALSDLISNISKTISVDASTNNSCDVEVFVKAVDNAGNSTTESVKLDIDVTKPTISISYDNNSASNSRYFDDTRKATIVITERTSHFDADDVDITITAVDAEGNTVSGATLSKMIGSWKTKEGTTENDATHTVTITYSKDANYTFSISYTDKAGNKANSADTGSSVAPYKFTVDATAPTGSITATSAENRTTTWGEDGKLLSALTFGFWSNSKITVTGTSDDATSPIESVKYYKSASATAMKKADLEAVTSWKNFSEISVTEDEQFVIYLKITDYAGNVTYINTDGLIVDETKPVEEYTAPEIYMTSSTADDVYNKENVNVSVTVTDPVSGQTYSGLKEITYAVYNLDVSESEPTQSGTLYEFTNSSPTSAQLVSEKSGSFVVNVANNNSNHVQVVVYAEDNAGNTSQKAIEIQMDTTAPVIDVSYSQTGVPENSTYYDGGRTATIVVTERNFDAKDIVITVQRTDDDGNVTTYTQENYGLNVSSAWTERVSTSANGDATTYTATITYSADGDYTFAVAYTDLAGNECTTVNYSGGNEQSFTLDSTAPTITVDYDDANRSSVSNGTYFDRSRTATITIAEHNFDANLVEIVMTKDGTGYTPSCTWSTSGNVHTASIVIDEDGDYTFAVSMTDLAGNECSANDVVYASGDAAEAFTVDQTIADLSISVTEVQQDGQESTKDLTTGTAHKYAMSIEIDYEDINLDSDACVITLNKARTYVEDNTVKTQNEDVTDEYVSDISADDTTGKIVIGNFQELDEASGEYTYSQEDDAIYTLNVTILDKAGNENTIEPIVFTVNRFGSVYVFNDTLVGVQDSYVQSVDSALVITEYNADRLVEDSLNIEITLDGSPLSEVSYTVDSNYNELNADAQILEDDLWYQYQYIIDTSNFETDGIYTLVVSTQDEAGNYPETTNYDAYEVMFRKDATRPEITSITGLEKASVRAESVDVTYEVYDAIGLSEVVVYVDDKEEAAINVQEEDNWNTYGGKFTIQASNQTQHIRVVVTDLAGNVTDTDEQEDGKYTFNPSYTFNRAITVSTNLLVLWYSNKFLFWGSILGVALVIGGGLFLIFFFKKKKKEEEAANQAQ